MRLYVFLSLISITIFSTSCYPLRNTDNANVIPVGATGGSMGVTWAKGIDSTHQNIFGLNMKFSYPITNRAQVGLGVVNVLGWYGDLKYNFYNSDRFDFSSGLSYGILDQYYSIPLLTSFRIQGNMDVILNARIGHNFRESFDNLSNQYYPLTNISRTTFGAKTLLSAEIGLERFNIAGVKVGLYNYKNEFANKRESFITLSIATNFTARKRFKIF